MAEALDFQLIWVRKMATLRILSTVVAAAICSLCISLVAPEIAAGPQQFSPVTIAQQRSFPQPDSHALVQDERLAQANRRIDKLEEDLVERRRVSDDMASKLNMVLGIGGGASALLILLQILQTLGSRRKDE